MLDREEIGKKLHYYLAVDQGGVFPARYRGRIAPEATARNCRKVCYAAPPETSPRLPPPEPAHGAAGGESAAHYRARCLLSAEAAGAEKRAFVGGDADSLLRCVRRATGGRGFRQPRTLHRSCGRDGERCRGACPSACPGAGTEALVLRPGSSSIPCTSISPGSPTAARNISETRIFLAHCRLPRGRRKSITGRRPS